ncbi:hypothetical protein RUND412_008876 [Rhizina undulata]
MTDLGEVLARLGLSQYLGRLIEEGFEKWETVLDITEQDLATLNFKLGHRRILQREIASARGVPSNQALTSYQYYPSEEVEVDEKLSPKPNKSEIGKGPPPTGKRKYRRHPKPDEHAPEKPPSAYVMFANRVRDELKGQNLSFTDIAKLVGEKWKVLNPEHKESYEFEASVAKDRYNSELQEYKKTESYRDYVQYLSEFKLKAAKEGREGSEQLDALRKRPKLESIPSSGSGGTSYTASSAASITSGINTPTISTNIGKAGSIGSSMNLPGAEYSSYSPPGSKAALNPSSTRSTSFSATTSTPISPKPPPHAPPDVARYRDSLVQTTQQQQEVLTASSMDTEPSFLSRIHPTVQSPHIQQQSSYMRHQPQLMGSQPPISRSGPSLPNPMLRRSSVRHEEITPILTSTSSSGVSSAPSNAPMTPTIPSFDEGNRSHRSLPSLPPPTPGPSSSGSYFDRPHHHPPPPRSPRSFSHHNPFPPPSSLTHPPHSYSNPSPTPQSLSSNQLGTDNSNPASGPLPPSSHPHLPHEKKTPS